MAALEYYLPLCGEVEPFERASAKTDRVGVT